MEKKMKIALCLYGHLGISSAASLRTTNDVAKESEGASTDPANAHHCFSHILFPHYDVDVFIHSWSAHQREKLLQLYKPKKSVFEPQIKFESSLAEYGMNDSDMNRWKISDSARFGYELLLPSRETVTNIMTEMERESFRTKSRWYSTKQSIVLKNEYEVSNNFEYDFTIVTRLDCLFRSPFNFEKLNPELLYATRRDGRPDVDFALHDFWFASNTENMNKFATLYDHIHDYCIRPTFACREHIKAHIGEEKLAYLFTHDNDYRKA